MTHLAIHEEDMFAIGDMGKTMTRRRTMSLARVAANGAPRRARRPSPVTGCLSAEHPVGLFADRTRHG
jgi:hypothetical protein